MSQTSSTCRPAGKPASRRILVSALLGSLVMSLAFAILANSAFGAGSIKVYSNSLETSDGRIEVRQVGSANCDRGGSSKSLRTELGKKTSECAYRVPFVGRDLVVGVKARLFKSTPKKIAKRTYVAVSLRQDGDGSRYQLAVFPVAGKFQLRKILPNGNIKYLDHGNKRNTINKLGEANRLTLRAYNGDGRLPDGTARVIAIVNGKKLAQVDDTRGNLLEGRDTTFSIGSKSGARGARGSFVDLGVSLPNPF